ncbi:MAG: hypothetical protein HC851_20380 [Acaryochloris sp. RU_4_1]|nr:hypothetical protein [Acaryochloris sp. RU_4_1]NJR56700.1 hypothetical protein [Acaryochloris sp. CRU_2_0]
MNNIFKLAAATVLSLPLVSSAALSAKAEDVRFLLRNETGVAMTKFQASPSGLDDWENDILGSDVLYSGYSSRININDGRTTCIYDLRGVFADGERVEKYKVNICKLTSFTFY